MDVRWNKRSGSSLSTVVWRKDIIKTLFFSRGKHPGTYFEFSKIQISSAIVPPQNKLTMVYGYDIPYGASRCTYKRKTFQRFGPQKKPSRQGSHSFSSCVER